MANYSTIPLGKAFLLRRDIKDSVKKLQGELNSSAAVRIEGFAGEADPKQIAFNDLLSQYELLSRALTELDQVIEKANCEQLVDWEGSPICLNVARKMKMSFADSRQRLKDLYTYCKNQSLVPETESVFSEAGTPITKKYPRMSMLDLPGLAKRISDIDSKIRELDTLIQQADWRCVVSVPEVI